MKAIVHVHQQEIKRNNPAIIVRTYKGSTHHRRICIDGRSILKQTLVPDACGARVTIATLTEYLWVDGPDGDLVPYRYEDHAPPTSRKRPGKTKGQDCAIQEEGQV